MRGYLLRVALYTQSMSASARGGTGTMTDEFRVVPQTTRLAVRLVATGVRARVLALRLAVLCGLLPAQQGRVHVRRARLLHREAREQCGREMCGRAGGMAGIRVSMGRIRKKRNAYICRWYWRPFIDCAGKTRSGGGDKNRRGSDSPSRIFRSPSARIGTVSRRLRLPRVRLWCDPATRPTC